MGGGIWVRGISEEAQDISGSEQFPQGSQFLLQLS